jgi:ribonuclease HI
MGGTDKKTHKTDMGSNPRPRKLFVSIALPRILYGIDVWCTPIHGRSTNSCRKGSVAIAKKLTTVQRAGALAVMGGFRTSPTDMLDAYTALLPIDLKTEKVCHNAITRIATLPQEHPLHKLIRKSTKRQVKRHCTPMHILTSIFSLDPSKMERIPPVCTHPKKRGLWAVPVEIPSSKEESKRADRSALKRIKVYSDGSAHDRGVGAAAILKREGKSDHILKLHLGTTEQHTVYKAKLVGMILGLHLIKTEHRSKMSCVLNIDNQAALVAINSEMKKSGQHLAAKLLQIAKQIIDHRGSCNFRLTFRWSTSHVGITGNKDADEAAKAAADGESLARKDLPPCIRKELGHSLSAV